MFKKVLSITLTLLVLFNIIFVSSLEAFAETVDIKSLGISTDDYEYTVLDDGSATITQYTGNSSSVSIPSVIDGYTVKSINGAFFGCDNITDITIPDSVITIGVGTFSHCTNLSSITIGKSVSSIGQDSFSYCDNLSSVNIKDIGAWCEISFNDSFGTPSGNPLYYAKKLLLNGDIITDLTIPNSVKNISNYAFCHCGNLTSVTIPDSVESIGSHAFDLCVNLSSVRIGNAVTSIGNYAFNNCQSMTSVSFGDSLENIESYAFDGCQNLTSVAIPKTVSYIGDKAFGYYSDGTWNYEQMTWNVVKVNGFTINCYEGSAAETYANNNKFTFVAYADMDNYKDTNVIFIDTAAVAEEFNSNSSMICAIYDKEYTAKPIDENTWVVDLDNATRQYDTTSDGAYHISSALKSITIFGGIQSYPCYIDETCYGDTLIFDGSRIEKNNYWNDEAYSVYFCHWKNHDNSKYGAVRGFDDDYNLVGETTLNFNQRISLLRDYIENRLPVIRPTTIDTDQYLIDEIAAQLGMKKEDVACLIKNTDIWNPIDSELPDGYSYDVGSYYLKEISSEKPMGYHEFIFDANTGLYALYSRKPSVIDFNGGGNSSGSSSSSSSSSSGSSSGTSSKPIHTFTPNSKYDVVRCDGTDSFTTVSHDSITPYDGSFYFFRPDSFYCFGYNTSSEMSSNGSSSGGGSSSGKSSYYPLSTPVISSVSDGTDGLTVAWNAVEGAVNYRVFVKGDTEWVKIGDTTNTSYLYANAKSGNAYTFTVQCISADGTEELSDYNDNTFGATRRHVDTPKVIKLQSLEQGNKISWNPVPGVARYRVSVKSRNSWKTLGDTYDTSFIHSSLGEGSIFAQQGVEYTYTVTCVSYTGYAVISDYNHTGWSITYTGEDSAPQYQLVLGDTDGDGELSVCDATVIQRFVAGIPTVSFDEVFADTDGDGFVTIMDATAIQRHLVGLKANDSIGQRFH